MRRILAAGVACALAVSGLVAASVAGQGTAVPFAAQLAAACPAGFHSLSSESFRESMQSGDGAVAARAFARGQRGVCVNDQQPEPFDEIAGLTAQRAAMIAAPFRSVRPGAYASAVRQRNALLAAKPSVSGAGATWTPYGKGPLIASDPRFDSVNGEGLDNLSGRVDSLDYDPRAGRLFATIGTGGVWASDDLGKTWYSIGDRLPTQVNGAVGWTSAGKGTVILASGEPLNGGDTYVGMGAFWSNDLGKHWQKAAGVPNGAMGYQVAVDPRNPGIVYVATSQGLYRSTDAGRSFANVRLPTKNDEVDCTGAVGYGRCEFANFVTDVVVQQPGGTTNASGGGVLAAVGYRASEKQFSNGEVEAPGNGLYYSATGAPGTFQRLDAPGFAPQERIGRTELGNALGPSQNHDFVYAIVQDARMFNESQLATIDAPDAGLPAVHNTVFNGIYVSPDFGKTWTKLADRNDISYNPATGSALVGYGQTAGLYAPGVQAWYNEWIKVDPTLQTDTGVPTRVLFGLEEVWANRNTDQPLDGSSQDPRGDFHVIGPYFAGRTCLFLDLGLPYCPTQANTDETTHPDQHDAIFVPDSQGGVTLLAGNDGGVFQQHVAKGEELTETNWGTGGTNEGFHTLLPYDAEMAKDGRTWFGLQDNGSGYIDPTTQQQFMTFGGDGFYVAVDPDHSDTAYSEVTFANMRVTTDGGQTWRDMGPFVSGTQFANPFVMDPTDANHLMTAGNAVMETTYGPDTQQMDPTDDVCFSNCWEQVFDLTSGGNESAQMSSLDLEGDAAYVGFCGPCDLLNHWDPGFQNGLATNVGGDAPPKRMTSDGWHIATAEGLPNRYITDVAIDPNDPQTVYVTLGGYTNRQWVPPGSYLDPNQNIGTGHVYRSTDAGEHFTDVSGNLPDAPAFTVTLHGSQVVVGTQVGVFLSSAATMGSWATLNKGLPLVPVNNLSVAPQDPNLLVAATFGRGVYLYHFPA